MVSESWLNDTTVSAKKIGCDEMANPLVNDKVWETTHGLVDFANI